MKFRISNGVSKVYFDCNGTTPVLPGAKKAAINAMDNYYGNPSSTHSFGLQSKQTMDFTRKMAAQVIGSEPDQIIFTSGATEAIQTAIFSVLITLKSKNTSKTKLLYGATEHKVIPQALQHWINVLGLHYAIVEVPVDGNGQIIMEMLMAELPEAALLCTMAVNNETGVIQNLSSIESALMNNASDVYWLVDCVQSLGKLDMELNSSRIDYAAFSGHKIYAPKGIGFLYRKKNAPYVPLIVGGGQENGHRSGTENLSAIAGFGYVLQQLAMRSNNKVFQSYENLCLFRSKLITALKEIFPKILFNTPIEHSIPTTLNFSIPDFSSQELLDVFDAAGLCLSAGSACNANSLKSSHVLRAMGKSSVACTSAIRLSFGLATTIHEIELGCMLLRRCGQALMHACLLENKTFTKPPADLYEGVLQFQSGSNNSWLIIDKTTRNCVIIDPCEEVGSRIEHYVKCQNLSVVAILDTHSHADHESIRPFLEKQLVSYFSEDHSTSCSSLGWPTKTRFQCKITLHNQEEVEALCLNNSIDHKLILARFQTPGHTDDSQSFLLGTIKSNHMSKVEVAFVFSGDMILGGGLGRTNFATSSSSALYDSLRKLETVISRDALICPAHDYNQSFCTSFNVELQSNTLMALALDTLGNKPSFIEKKIEADAKLRHLEENFHGIVCGTTNSMNVNNTLAILIYPHEIKNFLHDKATIPLVIDLSEQQAFILYKNRYSINIPLSRFTNFVSELLTLKKFNHELLFICRSGERSLQAALTLRKFGFHSVWSLYGGHALNSLELSNNTEHLKYLIS